MVVAEGKAAELMSDNEQFATVSFPVRNMASVDCAECVQRALTGLPGIKAVSTDLSRRRVVVEMEK
jgi:copper chaperone CopZ